jgi:hypothetical protein
MHPTLPGEQARHMATGSRSTMRRSRQEIRWLRSALVDRPATRAAQDGASTRAFRAAFSEASTAKDRSRRTTAPHATNQMGTRGMPFAVRDPPICHSEASRIDNLIRSDRAHPRGHGRGRTRTRDGDARAAVLPYGRGCGNHGERLAGSWTGRGIYLAATFAACFQRSRMGKPRPTLTRSSRYRRRS